MFQLKWLWHNLEGYRARYVVATILSILDPLTSLINPKLYQLLIDEVIMVDAASRPIDKLFLYTFGMIGMTLARTAMIYLMLMLLESSSQGLIVRIREKIYGNMQSQEARFFDKNRTGDLMTRMTGDVEMVRHSVAYVIRNLIYCFVMFIGAIIYFLTISPKFTLAMAAVTPLILVITMFFSKRVRPLHINRRETLSQLNTMVQENISGNRVVKAFANEEFEIQKFLEKNNDFRTASIRSTMYWLKFFPVIELLAQSLTLITVLVGGIFIINGELTFGQLASFSSLTWALSDPMRMLGNLLNDFQSFMASASKVIEVYYAKPIIQDRPDAKSQDEPLAGDITFKDVVFKYNNDLVFDHISFDVKSGQTLAIMGATGSGKTTIANLISRFYDVTSGSILVDGVDVRDWSLKTLRSNIGMATQDVFLFSDTIDGNIAYGDPDMPEEQVVQMAVAADADGFIRKTSDGYDTIIGERGVGLSGGQKQRIALARALAVRPSILILDDTTSAVDLETEKYIQEQLANLDFKCTKVIIAQRISSVKDADQIIILDDKKIVEHGTHEELVRKRGYYYDIFMLQNGAASEAAAAKAGEC